MAADIFISFASKDVKVALTLCSAIESRGFKCWISARDIQPGDNFQISIVQALRHAKVLLLVFTANSNTSEEMTKELALASQQKMIVIPLRVEDVTPSDAFAYEFATRQWIDAFADWENSIQQLCRRLEYALARGGEALADALETHDIDLTPKAEVTPDAADIKVTKKANAARRKEEMATVELIAAAAAADGFDSGKTPNVRWLGMVGAVIGIVAVIGIAATVLMQGKPKQAPPSLAAQALIATPAVEVEVAPPATEPSQVAEADTEAPAPVAAKPATPRKRVAVQQASETVDIPY